MEQELTAAEVGLLLRGHMGLIVGPDATVGPGSMENLSSFLITKHKMDGVGDKEWLPCLEQLLRRGFKREDFIAAWNSEIGFLRAPGVVSTLATMRWSSILSLSLDNNLENALQSIAVKNPLRPSIYSVDAFTQPVPPRSVPILKLMGSVARNSFPDSQTGYKKRRAEWRYAVRTFVERCKGNPILCFGIRADDPTTPDLFTELFADPLMSPNAIAVLSDDPLRANADFRSILQDRCELYLLAGSLSEMAKASVAAAKASYGPTLPFPVQSNNSNALLKEFELLAVSVNLQSTTDLAPTERHRLLDILFSPEAARWDAHVHELDFLRTLSTTLFNKLTGRIVQKTFRDSACVVKGSAASGKTMILKRLAFQLASTGEFVFWMRPYLGTDVQRQLAKLMKAIVELDTKRKRRVICIIDDPLGLASVSANDIANAARNVGLTVLLAVGVRSTDWRLEDQTAILGDFPVEVEEEVLDYLDDDEWQRLPAYLTRIGISPDDATAKQLVASTTGRETRDTLSLLYWLLPQTQVNISTSVRQQYFRLGDRAGFTKLVVEQVSHDSQMLKDAYELVAVADHYGVPVPIEILVSALKVDYGSWIDATKNDGPAWGLLYEDESDEGDTICYRTRNAIVTKVLIEAINGGSLSRTAEIARLRQLVDACTAKSLLVYEQFCVHLLVHNSQFQRLSAEDGLELYDRALKALPFADKTLLHHKGRWLRTKCQRPVQAEQILSEALRTANYPYAIKKETNEHIYTSMAAAVIDQIDRKEIDLGEGKERVMSHLEHANPLGGINANAVHVQGELMLRLIPSISATPTPDTTEMLAKSVGDIDRALMLARNSSQHGHRQMEDISYLDDIKGKLLHNLLPTEGFEEHADELWAKYKSQSGFVLSARKQFSSAITRNKGTAFNEVASYCKDRIARIEADGELPSSRLSEVMVQILYRWQVQRAGATPLGTVDWREMLKHSSRVVASPELGTYPACIYIHALGLCHTDQWDVAEEFYRRLRNLDVPGDVMWIGRDFLLDSAGVRRLLQGKLKQGATRDFFFADDLQRDFFIDRSSKWGEYGLAEFAYIQFTFAGPRAVDRYVAMS